MRPERNVAGDISALSNELRTPLAAIVRCAELLLARDDERTRVESGREILTAAHRLSPLIDDLLATLSAPAARAGDDGMLDAARLPLVGDRARCGKLRRILIADDDSALRQLVRLTLPADGFQIVEAHDGEDALEQISIRAPDLVVLDWNMPGRSGADVLDALRDRCIDVPVIVLTAETRPNHRALADALGARTFLTKPFSPLELLSVVESLLPDRV